MRSKSRRKKRRDPLVACNQEMLAALLADQHLTVAQLAKRSRELPQTLSHLLNTPGARCQRGRLKRIARALDVPPEMLIGAPYAIPVPAFFPDGFEYLYSARTTLAASRLLTEVGKAVTRDLQAVGTPQQLNALAPLPAIEAGIGRIFLDLIMISEWRTRFIRWDRDAYEARGYLEPALINPWDRPIPVGAQPGGVLRVTTSPLRPEKDPAHEAAILGIIRGFEHVFTPWFEGKAKLDYRALRDFTHLPHHPFVNEVERFEPTSPLSALPPAFFPTSEPATNKPSGGQDHA